MPDAAACIRHRVDQLHRLQIRRAARDGTADERERRCESERQRRRDDTTAATRLRTDRRIRGERLPHQIACARRGEGEDACEEEQQMAA